MTTHSSPRFTPAKFPFSLLQTPWYQLGRLTVDVIARSMLKMDVVGRHNIPAGPVIFACNHPSTTDPILLTTLVSQPMSILIIDTLFKIPVVGHSLRFTGHIRVAQGQGQLAFEQGLRTLANGRSLGIFPEGIISPRDGGIHPGHTGVARLAMASGVPIVPVGIGLDSRRIRALNSRVKGETEVGTWYTHGPYALTVGKPLQFTGDLDDRDRVRAVTDEIMEHIRFLAGESAARVRHTLKSPINHPLWTMPIRLPLRLLQGVLGLT